MTIEERIEFKLWISDISSTEYAVVCEKHSIRGEYISKELYEMLDPIVVRVKQLWGYNTWGCYIDVPCDLAPLETIDNSAALKKYLDGVMPIIRDEAIKFTMGFEDIF